MVKLKLFFGSLAITTCLLLALMVMTSRPKPRLRPDSAVPMNQIADGVFVTSQLQPTKVSSLSRNGIHTIIDLRPDGEAADQPPAAEMAALAKDGGLKFYYIPVPHEEIPDQAVTALQEALTPPAKPALLYCRTGRRAVRTFALVEASRSDGPDLQAILSMVGKAGFSADDLKDNIKQRIAHRTIAQAARN